MKSLINCLFIAWITLIACSLAQSTPYQSSDLQISSEDFASVKLLSVTITNDQGEKHRPAAEQFFSARIGPNTQTWQSDRRIENMTPGNRYDAQYLATRKDGSQITLQDSIHIAHDLAPHQYGDQINSLWQQKSKFKKTHSAHQYLLRIDSESNSAKLTINCSINATLNVWDLHEHLIFTKTVSPGKTEFDLEFHESPAILVEVMPNQPSNDSYEIAISQPQPIESQQEDQEFDRSKDLFALSCRKANRSQIKTVNRGNAKKEQLLNLCIEKTSSEKWCKQILRPNPSSLSKFRCTYGNSQVHQLIHPTETTWKHPLTAVKIITELEQKGIKTCQINNWWRPEPYNKNVGGSATRHPFGTSIDVYFCSKSDQNKAFAELCKMRKAGRLRAIGYYQSTVLHFGIGDRRANTWGKSCPN